MDSIIDRLNEVRDLDAFWETAIDIFRCEGFDAYAHCILTREPDGVLLFTPVAEHGFPNEVYKNYMNGDRWRLDPLAKALARLSVPVRWSVMAADPHMTRHSTLPDLLRTGDGYSMPVSDERGCSGVVAVGRARSPDIIDSIKPGRLHMIAQIIHMRARILCPDLGQPRDLLSYRESQIMHWVVRGKSNSVIADILGLSAATADSYLRRIFEKLNVTDRTSAAVRATIMGLADPI